MMISPARSRVLRELYASAPLANMGKPGRYVASGGERWVRFRWWNPTHWSKPRRVLTPYQRDNTCWTCTRYDGIDVGSYFVCPDCDGGVAS
jgi:hypothetical protein